MYGRILVRISCIVLAATALFGCSSSSGAGSPDATTGDDASDDGGDAGADAPDGDGGSPSCSSGNAVGASGTSHKSVQVNHIARTYTLHVPASAVAAMDAGCGAPLVIGLHGAGDTADNFLSYIGLEATGDNHGFIVAAPDAYGGAWFIQASEGWQSPDGNPSSLWNDVALVQRIISDVGAAYRVDLARIYVCGWSRGGAFTGLLAVASNNPAELDGGFASPFAAYGITAGYRAARVGVDFSVASPKRPVWSMHGTADQTVPFADGKSFADDMLDAGWPVTFTSVANAPHDWLWQAQYGHTNDDLWKFFASHPAQ